MLAFHNIEKEASAMDAVKFILNFTRFTLGCLVLTALLSYGMLWKVARIIGNVILIVLATTVASLWGYKTPEECPFVRGMLLIHFDSSPNKEEVREECSSF